MEAEKPGNGERLVRLQDVTPVMKNETMLLQDYRQKSDELACYPMHVVLYLTDHCNQECQFCFGSQKDPREAIFADPNLFSRMDWLRYCSGIQVIGAGEALCHPNFPRIFRTIKRQSPFSDLRLYTNGQGLRGKRLDVVLECATSVHISVNAITKSVFDTVVHKASHQVLMENLNELAQRKPKQLNVILSLVVLRETIHEVRKMVDFAASRGFVEVQAHWGTPTRMSLKRGCLPAESYGIRYADYVDVDELKAYAQERGVNLCMDQRSSAVPTQVECYEPWTHMRLTPVGKGPVVDGLQCQAGWKVMVCCAGEANLFATDSAVVDIKQVWNSERLCFIRRTVNSSEFMANKMCTCCRLARETMPGDFARQEAIRQMLRIPKAGPFPLKWVGQPDDPA